MVPLRFDVWSSTHRYSISDLPNSLPNTFTTTLEHGQEEKHKEQTKRGCTIGLKGCEERIRLKGYNKGIKSLQHEGAIRGSRSCNCESRRKEGRGERGKARHNGNGKWKIKKGNETWTGRKEEEWGIKGERGRHKEEKGKENKKSEK